MVTGKNKEQFDKFRENNFFKFIIRGVDMFYHQPFEMQIGVYLAYYDSLSIFIDSELSYDLVDEVLTNEWESGFWYEKDYYSTKGYFKTRNEAYKEALKEMDKFMNNEK